MLKSACIKENNITETEETAKRVKLTESKTSLFLRSVIVEISKANKAYANNSVSNILNG